MNKETLHVQEAAEELPDYQSDLKRSSLYTPNASQEEALFELSETREQGNAKALVVAATGVGKTFLAAFDSQNFKSVLFIAHRQEILEQALTTFKKIRPKDTFGRLFAGYSETHATVLFASVQSLQRSLKQFSSTQFEYIVVDEFHHAAASSYAKILDYFKPDFLLGLTATPHRMDKKNIFALYDYNLVYNADLLTAINRNWLSPFRYYGIYGYTVNYETITYSNGAYKSEELEAALAIESRADLIFKQYSKYNSKRALGFCSTIVHAEYMAFYFNSKGIKAITIHSRTNEN